MIPRFLILLPDDPLLMNFSVQLAKRLRGGYPDGWIAYMIRHDMAWMLSGYPSEDQAFTFNKIPDEIRTQLQDELPDYLIDFSDQPGLRLFKNRLKVVDFTLKHRQVKQILAQRSLREQQDAFHRLADQILGFFELTEPQPVFWQHPEKDSFLKKHLPESFLSGYLTVHLSNHERVIKTHKERVIKLLSMIEYSAVLIGDQKLTDLGDQINQTVGCSVFNAVGVLSAEAQLSVISGSDLLISLDRRDSMLGPLMQKPSLYLDLTDLPEESVRDIALNMKKKLER